MGDLEQPLSLMPLGELPAVSVGGDGTEPLPRAFPAERLLPLGTKA